MKRMVGGIGIAVVALTGCASQSPPAAAPPVPSPPAVASETPRLAQPQYLSFGQSIDMHSGVTVTVSAPKTTGYPYPSLVHPGEVGVQFPITAHNDRDTTWAGCSFLYTYVGLPTGEQVVAVGVNDGGPSHNGPVRAGATADCTVWPPVPAAWLGQEVIVTVSVGEPGIGTDSAPRMEWRGPLS